MESYNLNDNKSTKGITPVGQLGFLIMFFGAGFILTSIAQFAMGMLILPKGTPLTKMGEAMLGAMQDPNNVTVIRWMQAIGTFLLMMVPAYLYAISSWYKPAFWLGYNKEVNWKQLLTGFLIIGAAGYLVSPVGDLSKMVVSNFSELDAVARRMEKSYNEQVLLMSNLHSWSEFFIGLIIMALLPSVFEETFFRGAMQPIFERWFKNPWAAIIITSLIFSMIHMSIYLFISRFLLGMVLGLLFYYSKNIWVGILAHFLNNAIALSQLWYLKLTNKPIDLNAIEQDIPLWAAPIALAVVVGLFIFFKKISDTNRTRVAAREAILLQSADPFAGIAKNQNLQ